MFTRTSLRLAFAAVFCALAHAGSAHALERVTLRSGFSFDCVRHEPVADGHTRLFLSRDHADNFVDLASDQIVSVDLLPDSPLSTPAATVSPATTPAAAVDVRTLLSHAGSRHNIDVDLLASVVQAESAGRARAVSRTGAQGMMQLMPGTARQMGVADAFEPEGNINGGTAYLDALLTRYHDNLPLALAAYNAGPAAVDRYHSVPPFRETRLYVNRVLREFTRRKQMHTLTASR